MSYRKLCRPPKENKNIYDKQVSLQNLNHSLIKEYDIDGIECFHPSISLDNQSKYIEYANKNNLLISAGSDFHGSHLPHRKNITTKATLNEITWIK